MFELKPSDQKKFSSHFHLIREVRILLEDQSRNPCMCFHGGAFNTEINDSTFHMNRKHKSAMHV